MPPCKWNVKATRRAGAAWDEVRYLSRKTRPRAPISSRGKIGKWFKHKSFWLYLLFQDPLLAVQFWLGYRYIRSDPVSSGGGLVWKLMLGWLLCLLHFTDGVEHVCICGLRFWFVYSTARYVSERK